MNTNFEQSLAFLEADEGGFVNNPRDPGGATNKGITQRTYDSYRVAHGLPKRDVRYLAEIEVEALYLNRYWDQVAGDDLPLGLDYAMFDFAVNSGVNRAAIYLQKIVDALCDGRIGPKTLELVKQHDTEGLIDDLCDERQMYLETLSTFANFGHGWTDRVKRVRERAKGMLA